MPATVPVPQEQWEYLCHRGVHCVYNVQFAIERTHPGVGVAERGWAGVPAPPYTNSSPNDTRVTVACQESPAASDMSRDPASKTSSQS